MTEQMPGNHFNSAVIQPYPPELVLQNLFETMSLGVVYQDADGIIMSANPAAERLLGLTLDQLRGRTSADPRWRALDVNGADLPSDQHPSMIALNTGKIVRNMIMGIVDPPSQRTRWLSVTANPIFNSDDKPQQVCSMFEDITERRAAESALESISDAFVFLDIDWRFAYVNTPAARMLGHAREALLGQCIWDMFPETIGTISDTEYHRAIAEQVPVHFEQYYPPLSAWFEARAYPSPNGLALYFQIVTDRKAAEQKAQESLERLQESEQRLSLALESGNVGSYDLDLSENEFRSVSATFKTLFGYAPDAVFTRADSLNAVLPEDLASVQDKLNERVNTGNTAVLEVRVKWPDGSIHWLRSHGIALFAHGRPERMIGVTRDITEQKESEASLREANERHKGLLRDVLLSVTGGKLRLVEVDSGLPAILENCGDAIPLTQTEGLSELRHQIKQIGLKLGFNEERWQGLVIGASETGMNAVVHGGGIGQAVVSTDGSGKLQVRIRDWGCGINSENLPKATLARGWSSTTSLGYGLVMTLETIDRLFLQTGPHGTTAVLEQDREESPPA